MNEKPLRYYVQKNGLCSIPWLSAEIQLQKNDISPCCKYMGETLTLDSDFKESWNSDFYKNLRQKFINGETVSECSKCNNNERFSYKNFKNKEFDVVLDDTLASLETPGPLHLQFAASNLCNLACRMCSPILSSKLASIMTPTLYKYDYLSKTADNKNFEKKLENVKSAFINIRSITISGGEPLLDPIVTELIKFASTESKWLKRIHFSTNMTVYNQELFELLDSMNVNVSFSISLDGPKHIHEYIRYKCSWDTIKENVANIRKHFPKFTFGINTTTSIYNVGYVKETLEAFLELEKELDFKVRTLKNGPVFNSQLRPAILPDHIKAEYIKRLDSIGPELLTIPNSDILVSTARSMLNEKVTEAEAQNLRSLGHFYEFNNEFDRIAKTDFQSVYGKLD
jgi:sulfatase maturation enzyme AslB (radical SAM superfamily)